MEINHVSHPQRDDLEGLLHQGEVLLSISESSSPTDISDSLASFFSKVNTVADHLEPSQKEIAAKVLDIGDKLLKVYLRSIPN